MRAPLLLLPLATLGVWLTAAASAQESKAKPPAAAEPEPKAKPQAVDYQRDIAPILEANCNRCHTAKKAGGKLVTTSRADMLKGGVSGPAIEPGKPDKSILVEVIHHNEMPPKRVQPRVTADELKLLKAWIAAGAPEK